MQQVRVIAMTRFASGCSIAVLALGSSSAFAQILAPPETKQEVDVSSSAAAQPATEEENRSGPTASPTEEASEEIVVTAQRRTERLVDVPIAVAVVTGDQLTEAGVATSLDLNQVVPGLTYVPNGSFAQPTIRGIGTSISSQGSDANVALYIDGVYQPSQVANFFELNSIKQIEVLKGPQGTLFGRNATGGAITISTRDPSFSPVVEVSAGYGRFDEVRLAGYASTGVGDSVAIDLAVMHAQDDGYVTNIANGHRLSELNTTLARSKLRVDATPNLKFIVTGLYSKRDDNSIYSTSPINGNSNTKRLNPTIVLPTDPYEVNFDTDPFVTNEVRSISLHSSLDVGSGIISAITAYQKFDTDFLLDSDSTPVPVTSVLYHQVEKAFSQELNFASRFGGRFEIIAGLYYFNDSARRVQVSSRGTNGLITAATDTTVDTEATAAFAELNWEMTDRLKFIAGARYNIEEKSASGGRILGTRGTVMSMDESEKWNSFTPRLAAVYDLTPFSSLYASFSRGFKSGAYNAQALDLVPTRPEYISAYEVGYKLGRRGLSFNTSAYYYKYTDIQVQIQTNVGGISTAIAQNAADATVYGAEANFILPVGPLRVMGGLTYSHARYDTYKDALVTTPRPGGGNFQGPGDASGNELIRAPEFTGNLGLNYRHELDAGALSASVNTAYNSGYYFDPGNRFRQDAYFVTNATLTYEFPGDQFSVSGWVRNLTDEQYFSYVSITTEGDKGTYAKPRTFGVTLAGKF